MKSVREGLHEQLIILFTFWEKNIVPHENQFSKLEKYCILPSLVSPTPNAIGGYGRKKGVVAIR